MKKTNWKLLLLLAGIVLMSASITFGHKVYITPFAKLINTAETVAIAKVTAISNNKTQCTTRITVQIKIKKIIFGKYKGRKLVYFYKTIHFWRKAKYFWQKDCPSVHYKTTSMPRDLKIGDSVIAVINKWPSSQTKLAVMGLIASDKLEQVEKLLKRNKLMKK